MIFNCENLFIDKNNDGALTEDEFVNGCYNDESLRKLLAPSPTFS